MVAQTLGGPFNSLVLTHIWTWWVWWSAWAHGHPKPSQSSNRSVAGRTKGSAIKVRRRFSQAASASTGSIARNSSLRGGFRFIVQQTRGKLGFNYKDDCCFQSVVSSSVSIVKKSFEKNWICKYCSGQIRATLLLIVVNWKIAPEFNSSSVFIVSNEPISNS